MKKEVITNEQMAKAFGGYDFVYSDMKQVCLAQAEISFKAGQEYAMSKQGHEAISFLEGRKAGIREVVDSEELVKLIYQAISDLAYCDCPYCQRYIGADSHLTINDIGEWLGKRR